MYLINNHWLTEHLCNITLIINFFLKITILRFWLIQVVWQGSRRLTGRRESVRRSDLPGRKSSRRNDRPGRGAVQWNWGLNSQPTDYIHYCDIYRIIIILCDLLQTQNYNSYNRGKNAIMVWASTMLLWSCSWLVICQSFVLCCLVWLYV